jgi:hydrogenase/urease accessory protein HupE
MMKHRVFKFIVLSLLSLATVLTFTGAWIQPGLAHWADLSVSEFIVEPSQVNVTLTVPTPLLSQFDTDRNRQLSPAEVSTHLPKLQSFISDRLILTDEKGTQGILSLNPEVRVTTLPNADNTKDEHTTLSGDYTWPDSREGLTIRYTLFAPGIASAQSFATITEGDRVQEYVFTPRQTALNLNTDGLWGRISRFLSLGIEHIVTGYDHVLFLLTVLMGSTGFWSVLKIVTAFTAAHSITLSLAVLGIVKLPPIFVESVIALSIAYIAAENLLRKEPRDRWLLTFGFGLIHGLGFATILQDFNLPADTLALSLVSFNLGVELGQIAVVGVFFSLLSLIRRYAWEIKFRKFLSASLVLIGLYWFVQRAFLPTLPF